MLSLRGTLVVKYYMVPLIGWLSDEAMCAQIAEDLKRALSTALQVYSKVSMVVDRAMCRRSMLSFDTWRTLMVLVQLVHRFLSIFGTYKG